MRASSQLWRCRGHYMVLRNKSQFTVEELHMRMMWTNSDTDAPVSFRHEGTTAQGPLAT